MLVVLFMHDGAGRPQPGAQPQFQGLVMPGKLAEQVGMQFRVVAFFQNERVAQKANYPYRAYES
jgi:hypothetical protein